MNRYMVQGMEYSTHYKGYRSFRIEVSANTIDDARNIANKKYHDSIIESIEILVGAWEKMEIPFEELTKEQKRHCYESYVADCIYENGDNAPHMTYEEWCEESERLGEAIV